jgi:transcriptional regulator with XRE-family HTH domain
MNNSINSNNLPEIESIGNKDYKSIDYSIHKILKNLRKEKKLGIDELSLESGLSKSLLSKIESGEKKLSISTARILIDFYNPEIELDNKIRDYIRKENGYCFKSLNKISINDLMKNIRIDKLLNQTEVESLSGISNSLIQGIESGDKKLSLNAAKILMNLYKPNKKIEDKIRDFTRKDNGYCFDSLDKISINNLLKNLRIDNLLNRSEVESLSGISDSLIQAIESGEKSLTAKTFLKLLPVYEPETKELDKISEYLIEKGESVTSILMLCSKEIKSRQLSGLSTT